MSYTNEFKKQVISSYIKEQKTITELADEYNIAPSTVFVWIKSYNKNNQVFDQPEGRMTIKKREAIYQNNLDLVYEEVIQKDITIERLKKGYVVKGGGAEKVFLPIDQMNTK